MSFKGKVVLVTGAGSGIGAATAILFCKEGAEVVIVDKNEENLRKVEQNCTKVGNKPLAIKANVANDEDVKNIINETIAKYNKLDVLVNNAGVIRFGSILDGKLTEIYDEIMSINVRAVVQLTTLAAPYLVKTKGNIVNVASISGLTINKIELGAYCTSKAALIHFSRAAALELAPHGVRVNVVSPGPVYTNILQNAGLAGGFDDFKEVTALNNRISDPEEIADVIFFLASGKARGITGSNYLSDNGKLLVK
ncbi:3-oxoacyl-[acyl-carrier-protein] reductase FabG-like [Plodia interpunctella]|uniref:3-oxoacyl-[acyl-carrier-protein] reductase FabG-like n=1 Tax=Plodia interpunctella TaxID=58824 RepID=UPI0023681F49|nr:3-oxoacyl-[acyl-carrier-protein] reductase FabG-like [Plodia interpunctella]